MSDSTDPLAPQFDWKARYAEDHTPWDLGAVHPGLEAWVAETSLARGKVVVPGCGKGHDPLFLARAGFEVDAIDIVDLCAGHCAEELAKFGGRFHVTNFLGFDDETVVAHGGPWDLLYEHTIFCALAREQRPAFGAAAAASVKPGGHLVSFLFPIDKPFEEGGPPFRSTPEDLIAALGEAFELLEEAEGPVGAPERRNWKERRLLFRRK